MKAVWTNTAKHGRYYPFELNRQRQGFSLECRLHHSYGSTCACGYHSQAKPAQGECSEVKGRKVQLHLQEQVLIGPMLATFIASLSVRPVTMTPMTPPVLDAYSRLLC
jgi:transposase